MEREPPSPLTAETEQSWQVLCELLDFAADFTLVALLADDPYPARVLRDRLTRRAEARDWPLRACVVAADTSPVDAWMQLLDRDAADPAAVVWFEATALKAHDASWWRTFALRLNERRELLRRGAMRVLILVMPAAVKAAFREAASDLWSILQEALPVAAEPMSSVATRSMEQSIGMVRAQRAVIAPDDASLLARAHAPDGAAQDRAAAMAQLAARASDRRAWDEAVDYWSHAVDLYRELAADRPDAYLPDLALGLDRLTDALFQAGRPADAQDAAKASTDTAELLTSMRPDSFLPDLAGAWLKLGTLLRSSGQSADALEATREAVSVLRELTASHSDAYLHDLAAALNNLGIQLSDVGQTNEATAVTEEAVEIRRGLAARSDRFLPELATSLHNLGVRLTQGGMIDEALATTEESVQIRRGLTAVSGPTTEADLATSLSNYGIILNLAGRSRDALAPLDEAIALRRKLASADPSRFGPDLAVSLNARGEAHRDTGRAEAAGADFREALAVIWPSFERSPDTHSAFTSALLRACRSSFGDDPAPAWLAALVKKAADGNHPANVAVG